MNNRPDGPELEELHDAVMEVIDDYIDFEYSFYYASELVSSLAFTFL